jgi:hypothetical protein
MRTTAHLCIIFLALACAAEDRVHVGNHDAEADTDDDSAGGDASSEPICIAGEWQCYGDVWFLCSDDGMERLHETVCEGRCDPVEGCVEGDPRTCSYVDILFMIDQSPSMGRPQEDLAAAFPRFVDLMFEHLPPETSLHVGITTSNFFDGSCAEATSDCRSTSTPVEIAAHYVPPTERTIDINGSQGKLFEWEGRHYFEINTSEDRAPLKSWFTGAATAVGERGCSYEMHSAGAGYAAHEANAGTNEGFFRDEDAVLVVIFLCDEPDKSVESLETYYNMLVGQKENCGGDRCIITAGLIEPCIIDVDDKGWQFLNMFGEPTIWGNIHEPSTFDVIIGDELSEAVVDVCDEIGLI